MTGRTGHATTPPVSKPAANPPGDDAILRDWQAVRGDSSIQYSPVTPPEPARTPEWLKHLLDWLGEALGPAGRWLATNWTPIRWTLIALGVAVALYLLWRLLAPALGWQRPARPEQEQEWTPERSAALALLEDADALAAQGRFDEATHLLLQRSVGQIRAARPEWLEPSSTAREIAALPALPERARDAFTAIAGRVERSLFALRSLGAEDWQAARAAYADFALADLRAGAA